MGYADQNNIKNEKSATYLFHPQLYRLTIFFYFEFIKEHTIINHYSATPINIQEPSGHMINQSQSS